MKSIITKSRILLFTLLCLCATLAFGSASSQAKVSLNRKSCTISVGQTYQLKAKKAKKVYWKTSNRKIVSVTHKGKITGLGSGVAKIKAIIRNHTYTCKIKVRKVKQSSTKITVPFNTKSKLTLINAPKKSAWFSSNQKIVYYSNGSFKARAVGTATITAKYYGKSYRCNITVVSGETSSPVLNRNGRYTSRDKVALYIHTFKKLPTNFITKEQAYTRGWNGGSLIPYYTYSCIGGNTYYNNGKIKFSGKDKEYFECDIDTLGALSRGEKRLVYTNDGDIYYTPDHYATFIKLY